MLFLLKRSYELTYKNAKLTRYSVETLQMIMFESLDVASTIRVFMPSKMINNMRLNLTHKFKMCLALTHEKQLAA